MRLTRRNAERDAALAYWDAFVSGAPNIEIALLARQVDPALVETMDRMRSHRRDPAPAPAFVNQLEDTLMHEFATVHPRQGIIPRPTVNSRIQNNRLSSVESSIPSPMGWLRTGRPLLVAAVLALLLVALIGGAGTFLSDSDDRGNPAVIPAAQSNPAHQDARGPGLLVPLLEAEFPREVLPEGHLRGNTYRLTLEPGASLEILAGPYCGCGYTWVTPGAGAELVEAGSYTLNLDKPFEVRRADGGSELAPAGESVTLLSGDVAYFSDYETAGTISNTGTDPARILGVLIMATIPGDLPVPALSPGVQVERLTVAEVSDFQDFQESGIKVVISRLEMAASLEPLSYVPAGLDYLLSESGDMRAVRVSAATNEVGNELFVPPGLSLKLVRGEPGDSYRIQGDTIDAESVGLIVSFRTLAST